MQLEKSLSLEKVEQEFIHWRQNRRNSREAIPQDLWEKAAQLYPAYPTSMICQRLKLSGGELKQHMLKSENQNDLAPNPFVIAQMPATPELIPELPAELPALPEAFAEFTLKTPNRELSIKIPCDYLGQCFAHMGGLL